MSSFDKPPIHNAIERLFISVERLEYRNNIAHGNNKLLQLGAENERLKVQLAELQQKYDELKNTYDAVSTRLDEQISRIAAILGEE